MADSITLATARVANAKLFSNNAPVKVIAYEISKAERWRRKATPLFLKEVRRVCSFSPTPDKRYHKLIEGIVKDRKEVFS